jgi:hypothetical protein
MSVSCSPLHKRSLCRKLLVHDRFTCIQNKKIFLLSHFPSCLKKAFHFFQQTYMECMCEIVSEYGILYDILCIMKICWSNDHYMKTGRSPELAEPPNYLNIAICNLRWQRSCILIRTIAYLGRI